MMSLSIFSAAAVVGVASSTTERFLTGVKADDLILYKKHGFSAKDFVVFEHGGKTTESCSTSATLVAGDNKVLCGGLAHDTVYSVTNTNSKIGTATADKFDLAATRGVIGGAAVATAGGAIAVDITWEFGATNTLTKLGAPLRIAEFQKDLTGATAQAAVAGESELTLGAAHTFTADAGTKVHFVTFAGAAAPKDATIIATTAASATTTDPADLASPTANWKQLCAYKGSTSSKVILVAVKADGTCNTKTTNPLYFYNSTGNNAKKATDTYLVPLTTTTIKPALAEAAAAPASAVRSASVAAVMTAFALLL